MLAQGSPGEALLAYRKLLHEEEKRYFAHHLQAMAGKQPDTVPCVSSQSNGHTSESNGGSGRTSECDESESENKPVTLGWPTATNTVPTESRSEGLTFGDLDAEIVGVQIFDGAGQETNVFYPGEPMRFRIAVRVHRAIDMLNIGLRLRNKQGLKVYSWGTLNQDIQGWARAPDTPAFWDRKFAAGQMIEVDFECPCTLGVNLYEVQASVSQELDRNYGAQRILHWRDEAAYFQVLMRNQEYFFGGSFDLRMCARVRD